MPCPECAAGKISPNSVSSASYTILKGESYISLPLSRLARTDRLSRTLTVAWIISGAFLVGWMGPMHRVEKATRTILVRSGSLTLS
jgi:hypothetical protein